MVDEYTMYEAVFGAPTPKPRYKVCWRDLMFWDDAGSESGETFTSLSDAEAYADFITKQYPTITTWIREVNE